MANNFDSALIIYQLPNVQKISNSENNKSELQQQLFIAPAERKKNKSSQKQIYSVDQDQHSKVVHEKKEDSSPKKHFYKKQDSDEEKEPEKKVKKSSPWSGNIVDVKI